MRRRRVYDDPEYRRNRAIVRRRATRCAVCGRPFKLGESIDVDHAIPIAWFKQRGLPVDNSLANLRPTHRAHNRGRRPAPAPPTSRAEIFIEARGAAVTTGSMAMRCNSSRLVPSPACQSGCAHNYWRVNDPAL
jgi:5-methylcytosine-specific restriction endonuclease McrA